jgi:organic radical activating enzyme
MDKYFPIKTETACQLKWTWSTIHLYTGETNSCHRVNETSIDVENFDQFHNTPKKLADRQLMLNGQWPQGGCEYCKNIEDAGGKSDRQFMLDIPNLVPPELDVDPTAVNVTPRIVEVYLDNVCNMSCIYCEDKFSSRIQQENNRYGDFKHGTFEIKNISTKVPNFEQLSQKFWQWMAGNYSSLRRLHILGGEPFYQDQFEACMDFLETHANPELEFNIVTNLKVSRAKLEKFLDRIKLLLKQRKIKRFDVTCSIDCWGDEQEYIRHGINMIEWQSNFEYLVQQRWITLNINQTITGLGMKSMPALIEYLNTQRANRKIGHYFMACKNRAHLNPGIFGSGFFDKEFETVLTLMLNDTWQHKHARSLMEGLQLEFNTQQQNKKELSNLLTFLNENDHRRNLNWRETFPWLTNILDDINVV